MTCAPSEDSDQSEHPPSLIRVFAVRMNIPWVLIYPFSTQRRPWSNWALGGSAQSDLSLRWVLRTLCLFCHAASYIYISRSLSLGRTHGLGLMVMLSHCQFQVASNFDYRRAQSVLRSTDDFNYVGLIPRLILGCHILSILLSFSFQTRSTYLAYITPKLFLEETVQRNP